MMGRTATFLIDSGSAGNIISKKFLLKGNIDPQPSDHEIIYPNGTKQNADQIPCQKLKIDKYEDELDFFVVDTQSKKFDVILGKPWLEQYNPMINWKTHCVSFTQNGNCVTLSPETARSVDLCTATQFKRAVKKGLPHFIAIPSESRGAEVKSMCHEDHEKAIHEANTEKKCGKSLVAEKGSSHGEVNPTIKMPDRMGGHSQTTLTSISRKGKDDHPREKIPFGAWNIDCDGTHCEIGDSVKIQDSARKKPSIRVQGCTSRRVTSRSSSRKIC